MKIIPFISLFIILAFPGLSQPDSSKYYSASRLDYYTNEEVGEIFVFVPESQIQNQITIDIVFEYEFLNKGYPVASHGVTTVPLPLKSLREGLNEITVSFHENAKWTDSRKVWITVMPHRENAVKIDRSTGGLFVAGLPVIPFGFFTTFPVDLNVLEEEVVKGFNLVSPFQDNEGKTLKARKKYMDRCASLGLMVNYNLCSVAGGGGPGSQSLEKLSRQEKMKVLRKEIEMFRDHPALLAWYIADEPDSRGLAADSLIETYKLIKELDPYHPVSLLLNSPRKADEFSSVMDIVMTNPYPIPQGRILEVKEYTDIIKKKFWLEKPVWVVPQAFGGNEWWQREPNPGEIRAMTYLAVIYGGTGIQYFKRSGPNSFPKSTATWNECGKLALEIAELTPDIMSPYPAPLLKADIAAIHAKAWNRLGIVTIAVVNEQNAPVAFKLKMDGLDLTIKSDVMFENRQVDIREGVIEDIIDAYGRRVYRFDARHKLAQFKELFPGNLTIDPGFEDLSSTGVPAACFAYNGADRGSTFFIDSRRHFEGEHSLRMNNPSAKPGNRLSFYGIEPDKRKSYTMSIMAKTGPSSNKPGTKKDKSVQFRLALGDEGQVFSCSETWQKFEINAVMTYAQATENDKISPCLEMLNKGTAWFDLLQVYPDMELKELGGENENMRNIALSCIHPDVKICYTLDGSEPSISSTLYLIPFEIEKSATLKAAAFKDEVLMGYIER